MRLREPLGEGGLAAIWRSLPIPAAPAPPSGLPPIRTLDSPEFSGPDSLCFVSAGTPARVRAELSCAWIIAEAGLDGFPPQARVTSVPSIRPVLAHFLASLHDQWERKAPFAPGYGNSIHPTAVVAGVLEGGVVVGPHAVVEAGAYIGRGSRLGAGAMVGAHCHLGRECELQARACVGEPGFGFLDGPGGPTAMPHPGGVRLGDRVFLGAHATVMAGVLHPTELGDDCKLDAHCHIGHNARIGRRGLMAAYACLAGSARAGDDLRMGGYAALGGRVTVGNRVSIAAKAGVLKSFGDGSVLAGYPARPIGQWRRGLVSRGGKEARDSGA